MTCDGKTKTIILDPLHIILKTKVTKIGGIRLREKSAKTEGSRTSRQKNRVEWLTIRIC